MNNPWIKRLKAAIALFALLGLTACGGGGGGGGSTSVGSGSMSAAGGTVTDASGASVTVPRDALMSATANVAITSTPLATGTSLQVSIQGSATSVSKQYTLTQDSGFNFTAPVTVTLPYDTTGLTANDVLVAAYYDTALGKWVPISNGVDNRAAGTFTFSTTHFTEHVVAKKTSLPVLPVFDKGFDPAVDGIPMNNFGVAVGPDGTDSGADGNCAGMAGLAGWYFTNKKTTDGNAGTRFADNSALRNYLAVLQSKWTATFPSAYIDLAKISWGPDGHSVLAVWAASEIRNKLTENQAPIIAWVEATDAEGKPWRHYVLIYAYDTTSFKYYDPNIPGIAQTFGTNVLGQVTGWMVGGGTGVPSRYPVTRFVLYNSVGDHLTQVDLEDYYSKFASGSQQGIWGKFANLQVALPTSNSIEITGSVSTDTHLAGMPLYVHFLAPTNRMVKNSQITPTSPMVEILPDQQLPLPTPPTNWRALSVGSFVTGAPAAFAASFNTSRFTPGTPVTLSVIVTTQPQIYQNGVWAYGEVSTPQIPPTSALVANFTDTQNGLQASFDAGTSTPSADINGYSWRFGDGATASGVTASHTYAAYSNTPWPVTLTVTDSYGRTASTSQNVSATCPSGQVLQNGQCVTCPANQVVQNGQCVTPITTNYTNQVPPNFPTNIPIEQGATLTQSYIIDYFSQKQLTIVFQSAQTVQQNYALYANFLANDGWTVTNNYVTAPLSALYGIKANNEINITIGSGYAVSPMNSQVSISVLEK
ncbi:MAG: PKD domain-containing protein [Sulfuricella sp.]